MREAWAWMDGRTAVIMHSQDDSSVVLPSSTEEEALKAHASNASSTQLLINVKIKK